MNDKYLPLGSIVLLKGGKKRLMISGYATIDINKKDKMFDYCGCLYPMGVLSTDQNFLFDHEQIEKIYSLGYVDDEAKEFLRQLKENLTEENIKKILEETNKGE